ncbi:uncharacterized protein BDR25DRAFT_51395 [Lindgomyces ingoldianus]|uniref:Uncharacterized protein n=1 Tax=Lindgomyces ingoldianus TaxID=673940 RepID=A0ACB6QSJ1_9PLEO|nr:uncharacterized protein BDR25DRAFT_51395 [Lindgomyces ingoldianus]KAF2469146.1 hypothetical protein BDR25DRAFT_51395 [Lindgomyces ingoldianus]
MVSMVSSPEVPPLVFGSWAYTYHMLVCFKNIISLHIPIPNKSCKIYMAMALKD